VLNLRCQNADSVYRLELLYIWPCAASVGDMRNPGMSMCLADARCTTSKASRCHSLSVCLNRRGFGIVSSPSTSEPYSGVVAVCSSCAEQLQTSHSVRPQILQRASGGSLDQETLSCSDRGCALFRRRGLEDLALEQGASALGVCYNVFALAFRLLSSLISCTRRRAHRFEMVKVWKSTARGAHPGHVDLGVNLDLKPSQEVRRHRRMSV
jgi:hypothetical protein